MHFNLFSALNTVLIDVAIKKCLFIFFNDKFNQKNAIWFLIVCPEIVLLSLTNVMFKLHIVRNALLFLMEHYIFRN